MMTAPLAAQIHAVTETRRHSVNYHVEEIAHVTMVMYTTMDDA